MSEVLYIIIAQSTIFSLIDVFLRVPSLKLVLGNEIFHAHVTSDIPGNPHVFDNELISMFNTLPELSNFNMVWTNVGYKEPILIRGEMPPARLNSLSVYGQRGSVGLPLSVDLSSIVDDKRRFEVIISPDLSHSNDSIDKCKAVALCSGSWTKGFICMRNYLVPPGITVTTPEIIRLSDNSVIRKSETVVSGPANLEKVFHTKTSRRQLGRVILVALSLFVNTFWSQHKSHLLCECLLTSVRMTIISSTLFIGFSFIVSQLLFIIGKRRLRRLTSANFATNEFVLPRPEKAAETSQPCSLHKYWIMQFDVPHGSALSIKAIINPADQQYWSLMLYDEYGLPLPHYVFDESATRIPLSSFGLTGTDEHQNDEDAYGVHIQLCNYDNLNFSDYHDKIMRISVTSNAKGYALFRRVHLRKENSPERCREELSARSLRTPSVHHAAPSTIDKQD